MGLATLVFILLMIFPEAITQMFTSDLAVIRQTPNDMRWVFAATPIIAIQLIGAAYFQAIGKAIPALLLTLLRQGLFFIPLILISNFRCLIYYCYCLFFKQRGTKGFNSKRNSN